LEEVSSLELNCEDGAGLSSSGKVWPVAEWSEVGMATAGLEEGDVDEGEAVLGIWNEPPLLP